MSQRVRIELGDVKPWEILVWLVTLTAACLIVPPCMGVLADRASSRYGPVAQSKPPSRCAPRWCFPGMP